MSDVVLSEAQVHDLASRCLQAHGADKANADAVADVLAAAELDGCQSHGLMRLPGYVATLNSGKVNGEARPEVRQLAPSVSQVNGNGGFAPLALSEGRSTLIENARSTGIAAQALVNVHHFAALWSEVEPLTEAGLCAFACVSYKPAVIPAGGSEALYGTNPMAFGWPRQNQPAVIFDQASSVMARGEVMVAAREGHELPAGVGVDSAGNPSTDPNEVLKGALLAFGGHKGSSLAMMIELFAGALIGESLSFEAAERDNNDGGPPQGGELIIAMDPNRFGDPDGWATHADQLFQRISSQPGARLPSERRYTNRKHNRANGIPVNATVHDKVKGLLEND